MWFFVCVCRFLTIYVPSCQAGFLQFVCLPTFAEIKNLEEMLCEAALSEGSLVKMWCWKQFCAIVVSRSKDSSTLAVKWILQCHVGLESGRYFPEICSLSVIVVVPCWWFRPSHAGRKRSGVRASVNPWLPPWLCRYWTYEALELAKCLSTLGIPSICCIF